MALANAQKDEPTTRVDVQKIVEWVAIAIGSVALILLIGFLLSKASGESYFSILQYSLNGVLVGGVYALVSLGIVIINKASGIFNFSHGYMMLVGGLMFYECFRRIPSIELTAILCVITGAVVLSFWTTGVGAGGPPNETLLQRLGRIVASQQFLIGLAISITAAVVLGLILQNLSHNVLRGAIGGLVSSAALGLAVERFAIRPLLGQPILAAIMMTLAVALILQGAAALIWGTQTPGLPIFVREVKQQTTLIPIGVGPDGQTLYQEVSQGQTGSGILPNYRVETSKLPFFGENHNLSFGRNLVWGFGIAILCFTGFVLFFQFTNIGLSMRAVAENQVLAETVGLRVRTILAIAWAIATTMAMVAAVIQSSGPGVGVSALILPPLAFRAFPAVLLGGLESITGALVGSILVAVVEILATVLVDSSTGQEFAPFAVLMIVLMIKPDGLFGQREIKRV